MGPAGASLALRNYTEQILLSADCVGVRTRFQLLLIVREVWSGSVVVNADGCFSVLLYLKGSTDPDVKCNTATPRWW